MDDEKKKMSGTFNLIFIIPYQTSSSQKKMLNGLGLFVNKVKLAALCLINKNTY